MKKAKYKILVNPSEEWGRVGGLNFQHLTLEVPLHKNKL